MARLWRLCGRMSPKPRADHTSTTSTTAYASQHVRSKNVAMHSPAARADACARRLGHAFTNTNVAPSLPQKVAPTSNRTPHVGHILDFCAAELAAPKVAAFPP